MRYDEKMHYDVVASESLPYLVALLLLIRSFTQSKPYMAADKEVFGLSRVHMYFSVSYPP